MSVYPSIVFPEDPEFPIGHDDAPIGPDLYTVVASYIPDMVTDINLLLDHVGNYEIGATKAIQFDGSTKISLVGGEIKFTSVEATIELVVDTPTITTLTISNDLIVSNDLIHSGGTFTIAGVVNQDYVDRDQHELDSQSAEPGDPADDTAVIWQSNATGAGDAADIMVKITEGGGTTTFTLVDYSAI